MVDVGVAAAAAPSGGAGPRQATSTGTSARAGQRRDIRIFAGGFTGFMALVPLKVLVIKAVLLLMMGPLTLSGALLGWLGGRAMWRRRSVGREEQLQRVFGDIVALAGARRKALPGPVSEQGGEDAGGDDHAG